ncbi:hypothetical protein IV203_012194 [Nitzschia inconspicua]|uniref:CBM6 domain-containing protein n=1 Tax=Nitzschia inconspicua TaxID=303405 RepID=A0A9K3KU35_9STRA|nr:hypothetical protein IV203_012194 [Nitzschia inconspicua]
MSRHVFSSWSAVLLGAIMLSTSIAVVDNCFSDFNKIYEAERAVTNTNAQRTYIICPNKLYEVGFLDFNNNLRQRQRGGPPLPLRPNMKLQCGTDGARKNLCWITDGHLQVDGTAIRGLDDDRLDNVELVGFVFIGSVQHSTWIMKPGSVTFRDCEWREHTRSRGPIMLDYHDAYANNELVVIFENCLFRDNRYFGLGAQTALVVANSDQNRMIFRKTVFYNNDMLWNNTSGESRTHVVESLGPTQIEDSCFINNKVSSAAVAIYGNQLVSNLIHSTNTGGISCQFASVFETLQQYKSLKPKCVGGDSSLIGCAQLSDGPPPVDVNPVKHIVPFTTNALDYDEAFEVGSSVLEGGCNRVAGLTVDGPDAQNTDDKICLEFGGCHVSHSAAGEYLVYKFTHANDFAIDGNVLVDVMARIASPTEEKLFRLELMYNGQVEYSDTFASPGLGYKEYRTITWNNVPLRSEEYTHSIRIWFVNGNINFCSIGVNYVKEIWPTIPSSTLDPAPFPTLHPTTLVFAPTRKPPTGPTVGPTPDLDGSVIAVPPITWSALDYYQAFEKTPDTSLGGCNWRNDGVDAQPTTDTICRERDGSNCNIGWWEAEEYLTYRFTIPSNGAGDYDIRVRAASNRAGRHMKMELMRSNGSAVSSFETYDVPSSGFQSFEDLFWTSVNIQPGAYILKIYSKTGIPGFYSALYYTEGSIDNTPKRIRNCPYRKDTSIDANTVIDSVCKQATTEFAQHCTVSFTEPNETLIYAIENYTGKSSLKVTLRVASFRSRDLRIELFTANGSSTLASKTISTIGKQDWNVYDTITLWNSVNVGSAESLQMKVTFLNGQVNLCAFGIE